MRPAYMADAAYKSAPAACSACAIDPLAGWYIRGACVFWMLHAVPDSVLDLTTRVTGNVCSIELLTGERLPVECNALTIVCFRTRFRAGMSISSSADDGLLLVLNEAEGDGVPMSGTVILGTVPGATTPFH